MAHDADMVLRRIRREKDDVDYDYWALVECVRTARGPRQRVVATIGKLSNFKEDERERIGWEDIGRVLSGKPAEAPDLFRERKEIPEWATVNTRGIQIEWMRRFGDVYLEIAL